MPFLLAQAPPKVFHTPANWLNCSETGSKSTLVECQGHGRIYSITVSLRNDPQNMMRPAGEVVGASTLQRWAHSVHTLHDYRSLCLDWASCCLNVRVPCPHSPVESLTSDVMGWGGGAFGRWSGHEGGALLNGISAVREQALLPWEDRPEARGPEESPQGAVPAPWSQTPEPGATHLCCLQAPWSVVFCCSSQNRLRRST